LNDRLTPTFVYPSVGRPVVVAHLVRAIPKTRITEKEET